jgi:hypothetical protein
MRVVTVKVEPLGEDSDANAPRTRYWMGTTPKSPIQNITAGGQSFPRFSGTPVFDARGQPDRDLTLGTYNELTAKQVETVKHAVAARIVRRIGSGDDRRAIVMMRDAPSYRVEPGDEPLAKYVYMAACARGEELPPSMLE